MPITDAPKGRTNRIVIAGLAGVGLIVSSTLALYQYVKPAIQIEQPDGDVLLTVSDHGAVGVKSGSGVDFGDTTDCLKSGGNSGATMTWGTCGSGGSASINTGAILNAGNDRFVNVSGDTMTGSLNILNGKNLQVAGSITGSTVHAISLLSSSGTLVTESGAYIDGTTLVVQAGNDRVGIGTATPASPLQVLNTDDRAATTMSVATTVNTSQALNRTGMNVNSRTAAEMLSSSILYGGFFTARADPTGRAGSMKGFYSQVDNASTSFTIPSMVGAHFDILTRTGTTTTDAYGFLTQILLGQGTITNTYGVYIGDVTAGTQTNQAYGLYQADSGARNYMAGPLNILGTLSGSIIKAKTEVASSGSVVWEGSASGASLWVSTFEGAGLTDCDASASKLLWDATAKRFTCGTDLEGEEGTTYTAGQGLTLTDTAFSLNTSITGALLEFATVSGAIVHAQSQLRSSGSLTVEGTVTFATALTVPNGGTGFGSCTDGGFITGNGTDVLTCNDILADDEIYIGDGDAEPTAYTLGECNDAEDTLNYDPDTNSFTCGTDADTDTTYTAGVGLALGGTEFTLSHLGLENLTDPDADRILFWDDSAATSQWLTLGTNLSISDTTLNAAGSTYTAGQGLALNSTAFSVGQTISGTLLEFQTVSGSVVYGSKSVRSSGSLVWEGAASGATLYVATSIQGSGLTDCDAATSKLLWNDANGRFSCGTDDDVPESGDFAAAGDLEADGTITDGVIDKADLSTSTDFGEISTDGSSNLTIDADVVGQSEVNGNTLDFAELQDTLDMDAATSINSAGFVFVLNEDGNAAGDVRIEGDANANLFFTDASADRVGIGTATPKTTLDVIGTLSGTILTLMGERLTLGSTTEIDLEDAKGDNRFEVDISTSGADTSTVTLTNSGGTAAIVMEADNGETLFEMDDIDGDTLVSFDLDTSPTISFDTLNGSDLFFLNQTTGLLGIGTSSPKAKLDVVGAISGTFLTIDGINMSTGAVIAAKVSTQDSIVVNTTSETNFSQKYTIPANSVRPGDSFRFWFSGSGTQANSLNNTFRIKLGSTTILTFDEIAGILAPAAFAIDGVLTFKTVGAGGVVVTSAQYMDMYDDGDNYSHPDIARTTVDTTANQDLQLSFEMSSESHDDWMTLWHFVVEKISPVSSQ